MCAVLDDSNLAVSNAKGFHVCGLTEDVNWDDRVEIVSFRADGRGIECVRTWVNIQEDWSATCFRDRSEHRLARVQRDADAVPSAQTERTQ